MADSKGGSRLGPKVIVAVIDSGIDYNHPDLKDEMWKNPKEIPRNGIDDDNNGIVDDVYGADMHTEWRYKKGNPLDDFGHGTHCAGIIAASANNGRGIAGVAGQTKGKVKIMAIKYTNATGYGSISSALAGLEYAIANGAKISSHSYRLKTNGYSNSLLERILRKNPQHLLVSATGNDSGKRSLKNLFPAGNRAPNHICVAALDEKGNKAWYSNYGLPYAHVFAPGSEILSTYPRNKYETISGTSMACPQVSGLAALVMSMRERMTAVEVKKLIEHNVVKKSQFKRYVTTGGQIDVGKTIGAVSEKYPDYDYYDYFD